MDVGKRVGANIKRLREAQGISQEELADRSGLHRTYVSQVERGVKNATIASLDRIATGLKVPLTDLVADPGTDRKNPDKGPGERSLRPPRKA